MFRCSWFALPACLALTLAGCQEAGPPPAADAPSDAPAADSPAVDTRPNVEGRKVFDALKSSLKKGAMSPAGSEDQPGQGAEGAAPAFP